MFCFAAENIFQPLNDFSKIPNNNSDNIIYTYLYNAVFKWKKWRQEAQYMSYALLLCLTFFNIFASFIGFVTLLSLNALHDVSIGDLAYLWATKSFICFDENVSIAQEYVTFICLQGNKYYLDVISWSDLINKHNTSNLPDNIKLRILLSNKLNSKINKELFNFFCKSQVSHKKEFNRFYQAKEIKKHMPLLSISEINNIIDTFKTEKYHPDNKIQNILETNYARKCQKVSSKIGDTIQKYEPKQSNFLATGLLRVFGIGYSPLISGPYHRESIKRLYTTLEGFQKIISINTQDPKVENLMNRIDNHTTFSGTDILITQIIAAPYVKIAEQLASRIMYDLINESFDSIIRLYNPNIRINSNGLDLISNNLYIANLSKYLIKKNNNFGLILCSSTESVYELINILKLQGSNFDFVFINFNNKSILNNIESIRLEDMYRSINISTIDDFIPTGIKITITKYFRDALYTTIGWISTTSTQKVFILNINGYNRNTLSFTRLLNNLQSFNNYPIILVGNEVDPAIISRSVYYIPENNTWNSYIKVVKKIFLKISAKYQKTLFGDINNFINRIEYIARLLFLKSIPFDQIEFIFSYFVKHNYIYDDIIKQLQ